MRCIYVENKLVRQGPALSLDKTNDILIGYLLGLGYKVLKRTRREVLQTGVMDHMERKKLWKLGEDKAKFLSERGSRKRKKSQVKKIVQRKSRKLSDGKKSESVNLSQKSSSVKAKRKLSKKRFLQIKRNQRRKSSWRKFYRNVFCIPMTSYLKSCSLIAKDTELIQSYVTATASFERLLVQSKEIQSYMRM